MENKTEATVPYPILPKGQLAILTVALSLGTFMQVLDTSIANVSLPAIAGDLAVSPNQGTWVITSFGVSNAISLPLTGWLARRFGEVRLFVISTVLFTLASWLCGLSPNLGFLIGARILQGAVAGPMIPLSQSLLLSNYPPEKKGLALALWAMTVIVAPLLGPIMGGWITDNISWPWIFYINIPVGFIAATLVWSLLKKRETKTAIIPVDMIGLALLIVGIGTLQVLLDTGHDKDWFNSSDIITLAVISFIGLAFFIAWELTEKHPIVDLFLFKDRNFTIATIVVSLGYLVFFGNVVILPLWLQTQMGYTATWAGMAAAPIGILSIVFSPFVGKNLSLIDLRLWACFAFLVFAGVSFWNSGFNIEVSFWQLVAPRIIMGAGLACFFVPLTALCLSNIPHQMLASATGLFNFMRILAGSFGTSISVTLWERRSIYHHAILTESITNANPYVAPILKELNLDGIPTQHAIPYLDFELTRQAYMLGTNDIFLLSGWLFLIMAGVVWLAKPPKQVNAEAGMAAH